jgi:ribosomal protein S18 acetylase RimI-like enzyme
MSADHALIHAAFPPDARSLPRRPVYLGEGLTFEIQSIAAEAIDVSPAGLGLALTRPAALPRAGDAVTVRYTGPGASGEPADAVVRHVGELRTARRTLPRVGLELVPGRPGAHPRFPCPDALPAFATAPCPWFPAEHLRFRVVDAGADGMTLRTTHAVLPGAELDVELHLPLVGVERARMRWSSTRDVRWLDPPPKALARYLLCAHETLTPAALRAAGLAVGNATRAFTYDYATTAEDFEQVLALRLLAHQADGHLESQTTADMRSPYDAHSRHLTCRSGGRIVGYVRVIFVDGDPERSQYVSMGGHVVPQWLWDAGFVEAGAGAVHPDFQRAGLYGPLMDETARVAARSGCRYVLGACPDELVRMYGEMGYEVIETRTVEPKPGWRFRSHLLVCDLERAR